MTMLHSRTLIAAIAIAIGASASRATAQVAQRPAPPQPAAAAASETPPAGATGRCRDGSFTTGQSVSADCATRGGMLVAFPVRQAPRRGGPAITVAPSIAAPAPELQKPASDPLPPPPAAVVEDVAPPELAPAAVPMRAPGSSAPAVATTVTMARPQGATGQCKDGSYLVGNPTEAACAARGGLAVAFPTDERAAPPRAAAATAPATGKPAAASAAKARRPIKRNQ